LDDNSGFSSVIIAIDSGYAGFLEFFLLQIAAMSFAFQPGFKSVLGILKVNRQVFADIKISVADFLNPIGKFSACRRTVIEITAG